MTEQNQGPVVTDYTWRSNGDLAIELIDLARDAEYDGRSGDARIARMAASRLEAALPSGVRVKPLPRAPKEQFNIGWTLPVEFLEQLRNEAEGWADEMSIEGVQSIALSVERRILSAIEPTQAQGEASDTRCDYCRENGFQHPNLCDDCRERPAPSELEVVAWLVVINGKFNSLHWTEGEAANCITHFNNGSKHPLVTLTDAQAAIAAAEEAENEAKDSFWAIYPEWIELKGHGISTEAARTMLVERAEAAEARVAELEKALKPFADDETMCDVNSDYAAARAALKEHSND